MPIAKSAKRALRSSIAKRVDNQKVVATLKRFLKKPGQDSAQLQQVIDKAAKKGIIHWQKAARLKSRLVKRLAKK